MALRQRLVKVVRTGKDRAVIVVAQTRKGMLEAWTMFARSKLGSVKNERRGMLLWGAGMIEPYAVAAARAPGCGISPRSTAAFVDQDAPASRRRARRIDDIGPRPATDDPNKG